VGDLVDDGKGVRMGVSSFKDDPHFFRTLSCCGKQSAVYFSKREKNNPYPAIILGPAVSAPCAPRSARLRDVAGGCWPGRAGPNLVAAAATAAAATAAAVCH